MAKDRTNEAVVGMADIVETTKVDLSPRTIEEDKGGGQINVTLEEGAKDRYVELRHNGKTVDGKFSVNGFVQLRFPKGWPTGDFQYIVV